MPRHPRTPQSSPKSPAKSTLPSAKPLTPRTNTNPFTITQRLKQGNPTITPQEAQVLQRTLGNAAVARLLQHQTKRNPLPPTSTTPPIQRIDAEEAEENVKKWFKPDVAIQVWNLMIQRLANAKMTLDQLAPFAFYQFMYSINSKLDTLFLKWSAEHNLKPKDEAEKFDQFLDFVTTLASDTPKNNPYLREVVYDGLKMAEWPEEEDDSDFADDEKEDENDFKIRKKDLEEQEIPDPSVEEEEKIKATGEREDNWKRRKSEAIEKISASDKDAYDVTSMEDLLKGRDDVTVEEENRQMKKKGNSTFVMRPKNAGTATIVLEKFTDPYTRQDAERTLFIEAEVIPTTTTGRLSAPEPESGLRVGTSKDVKKRRGASATDEYRNQGFVDAQKGHIIALELGGPDVPKNIVPQWANWQANGIWRKMETSVLAAAKEYDCLKMRVQVHYKSGKDDSLSSFRSLAFPTHFTVTVWEVNPKTKAQISGFFYEKQIETGQDHTDDKLMFRQDDRQMKRVGQESVYDPSELKSGNGGRKKPATKSPAKKKVTSSQKPTPRIKKKRVVKKKTPSRKSIFLDSSSSDSDSEVEIKKKKKPTPKKIPVRRRRYSSSSESSSSSSDSESEVEIKKKKAPVRKPINKRRRVSSSSSESDSDTDIKPTPRKGKNQRPLKRRKVSTTKSEESSDEDMKPTVRRSNRLSRKNNK